jgi:tRNA U34 5-methylaminomethyl-2-thiouridine-forming methyltransferase MnmC
MRRQLFITDDGSHSIRIDELNVSYHSKHGAIQESRHIYIATGFNYVADVKRKISILEMGFGTGLNALLTLIEADKNDLQILYDVVELHPLDSALISSLNYLSLLRTPQLSRQFSLMHDCEWNKPIKISGCFAFRKLHGDIKHVELSGRYDIIYFDAFDPAVQPELWTVDIFKKMYVLLNEGGVLVTYCSKGIVREAMNNAGFRVVKLEGPKGKREIVRAIRD